MILVALLMTALLGCLGLAIDYGQGASLTRTVQNAADGAAQTAGYQMYIGASESAAIQMADTVLAQHGLSAANLTVLQFLDAGGNPTTVTNDVYSVHAVVATSYNTFLMRLLGISTVNVNAQATVKVGPGNPPCVFCVLNKTSKAALGLNGYGSAVVTGGPAIVDSDDPNAAAVVTGNATFTAPYIGVVGGYQNTGNATFNNGGPGIPPATGIQSVPDPLARVQDPLSAGLCGSPQGSVNVTGGSSVTITPGTYDSISMPSSTQTTSLTLQPGVYCITGALNVAGGTFTANGVTLYFLCGTSSAPSACSSGAQGGSFSLSGNGVYDMSAPSSGPYDGMAIFYDRNNTSTLSVAGTSSDAISGTIYGKSSALQFSGTAGTFTLNSMVVGDTVSVGGSTGCTVQVAYDANLTYPVPILPVFTQ